MKSILMGAAASTVLLLAACQAAEETTQDVVDAAGDMAEATGEAVSEAADAAGEMTSDAADAAGEAMNEVAEAAEGMMNEVADALPSEADARLAAVLAHPRRADDMARDEFRNPGETLAFFGLEPDMTVVEALPGGGWYGRIIAPYVADEGSYHAINYPMDVFEAIFGDRLTEERAAQLAAWEETFPAQAAEWGGEADGAFRFGATPEAAAGQVDMVLYIRALHNMARTGRLDVTASDAFTLLKPGGVVGVVQHRAPAGEADDRATGSRGYLREADVVAVFEAAGFTLEDSSDINANPNDSADYEVGVWMLPPTNGGDTEEEDVPPLQSVGESDRMTLKFRKPE
ncbi:MAG: methyltransferase [Pseudomonadota bacterium]